MEKLGGVDYRTLVKDPAPEVRQAVASNLLAESAEVYFGHDRAVSEQAIAVALGARSGPGADPALAAKLLGEISTEFARDTADISDRENVQYHWIRIEDVPQIWERLASVGLQTTEACGDCPRVVLGSPARAVPALVSTAILIGGWTLIVRALRSGTKHEEVDV